MLCSVCQKKSAIILIQKPDNNGTPKVEGLCYDCAKEKGINPFDAISMQANLSEQDLQDMTKQFESMFKDMSENLNEEDLKSIQNIAEENGIDLDEETATPLGSILSGLFSGPSAKTDGSFEAQPSKKGGNTTTAQKEKKKKENKKKFLDTYGTNLTAKAKSGALDAVIGRDREIQRMIQILNRRGKNNPCLIGEPGVGKTAIAQGLAQRIAQQKVPAKLLNKEVYLLDMTAIVAGTQFRGQFESRMKSLIDECKSFGNIILVIDEIHNIIGAGDTEHAMNAANILKPSLSNGEIQLIGTTTLKEYRKYIEKDSALERRFQPVLVE